MRHLLAVLCLSPFLATQRAGITPMQVTELQAVTGVFPSPDGATVAFTRAVRGSPTKDPAQTAPTSCG